MDIDLAALPDDVETLHLMVRTLAVERDNLAAARSEIERLQLIIRKLQRHQFGRRSEGLDDDQLELGLEDLASDLAKAEARLPRGAEPSVEQKPGRQRLAEHLPREEVRLHIADAACPCCGGTLHVIGETVSEMLDHVPAKLRVIRICRPRYGCRACGTIHQAEAPQRPIAKGLASAGLLAHVLVSKYADHLPLYRQSQIFARHGVTLDRSTLANWVGGAAWWLEPLQRRLAEHLFESTKLFPTFGLHELPYEGELLWLVRSKFSATFWTERRRCSARRPTSAICGRKSSPLFTFSSIRSWRLASSFTRKFLRKPRTPFSYDSCSS